MAVSQLLVKIDATTEQLRRELSSAGRALNTFSAQTDRQVSSIEGSFNKLGTGLRGIQSSLGALGIAMGGLELAKGFVQLADAATTMENRLKSVTSTAEELSHAQNLLYESSQANSIETSTSVELFTRLSRALQGTGADSERVAEMVDTLSKTIRLSGATSAEASSAMLQFSQAMNKGKLNGDEFRSMSENLPMLLTAIATELANLNGISLEQAKAELQEMSAEGTLTTDIIVGAMENMREGVVEVFSELESTAGAATTRMWNSLTHLVGKINDVTGISGNLVEKINGVTAAFDFGVSALDRYGGSLSTLLGWINSIPHPLSLLAQAAAGAASQVSQAAGEIQAAMQRAGAARDELGSGVPSWKAGPGEGPKWGGNITRKGDISGLADKLAGGLKVAEATGGRPVSPALTNPMDVAALTGSSVDFTTFGVGAGGTVTGVTRDKPKLKSYKGESKEETKASASLQKQADDLKKSTRTAQEKYQSQVSEYKGLLDKELIDPETYSRSFAQAGEELQSTLMGAARKGAMPKPKKAKGSGGRSGGGTAKKTEAEKEEEKAANAAERSGESVFKRTRTDAEAYGEEIKRLDELLTRNAISQEDHARATEEAGLAMQESRMSFVGGQEAARVYLDEIARLDGMLKTGAVSQDEYNARVVEAQQKYANSKSSASEYAAEVTRLDQALAAGAISEEEHAASLAVARAAMNEGLQESARLWEETRTPVERYYEELRKISELWAAGVISDDTKMRAATQAWEEMRDEVEKTNATMKAAKALGDDLGMSFASAFEDAILEGGKLRDIMKGLWEDIQRIVVRQMVTVPLATGLSAMMTGVAGAMMGGGTAIPAAPTAGFQHGGWVRGDGSGTSDSIPAIMPGGGIARLSNGEFIVNAKSAAKHERLLQAINGSGIGRAFAVGGPIGNIQGQGAGGGPGQVQIILENKSSQPLKTEGGKQEGPGPDGRTMIRVMVVDAVKGALASGEFDRTMGARYGAGVQPIAR